MVGMNKRMGDLESIGHHKIGLYHIQTKTIIHFYLFFFFF